MEEDPALNHNTPEVPNFAGVGLTRFQGNGTPPMPIRPGVYAPPTADWHSQLSETSSMSSISRLSSGPFPRFMREVGSPTRHLLRSPTPVLLRYQISTAEQAGIPSFGYDDQIQPAAVMMSPPGGRYNSPISPTSPTFSHDKYSIQRSAARDGGRISPVAQNMTGSYRMERTGTAESPTPRDPRFTSAVSLYSMQSMRSKNSIPGSPTHSTTLPTSPTQYYTHSPSAVDHAETSATKEYAQSPTSDNSLQYEQFAMTQWPSGEVTQDLGSSIPLNSIPPLATEPDVFTDANAHGNPRGMFPTDTESTQQTDASIPAVPTVQLELTDSDTNKTLPISAEDGPTARGPVTGADESGRQRLSGVDAIDAFFRKSFAFDESDVESVDELRFSMASRMQYTHEDRRNAELPPVPPSDEDVRNNPSDSPLHDDLLSQSLDKDTEAQVAGDPLPKQTPNPQGFPECEMSQTHDDVSHPFPRKHTTTFVPVPMLDRGKVQAPFVSLENADSARVDYAHQYNSSDPVCRRCNSLIEDVIVRSADGMLDGVYHKECFSCAMCGVRFPGGEFYVIDGKPFCEQHYHEWHGTICVACGRGIEGVYYVTNDPANYHIPCLACEHEDCGKVSYLLTSFFRSSLYIISGGTAVSMLRSTPEQLLPTRVLTEGPALRSVA